MTKVFNPDIHFWPSDKQIQWEAEQAAEAEQAMKATRPYRRPVRRGITNPPAGYVFVAGRGWSKEAK